MERQSGRKLQQRVWDETKSVLEKGVPDVVDVYKTIDDK